jgi:tetratricopeptide (TPR) repeat protein
VIAQHQKNALKYEKSGNLPMAVLSWKLVASMDPENREAAQRVKTLKKQVTRKAEKHFSAGVQYFMKHSVKEARVQFLKTLRYNPDHAEALDYLKNKLPGVYSKPYRVQQKDTLKKVAASVYKDPEKEFLIAYFNDLDLNTRLTPGTTLQLPVLGEKMPGNVLDTEKELVEARKFLKEKKYTRALQVVEKIVEYDPVNPDASELLNASYYGLGKALQESKKFQESLEMYNSVNSDYHGIQEAIAGLHKVVKEEAEVCYRRGVNFFVNEKLTEAIQEWQKALKLNPEHAKAQKNIEKARSILKKME